MKTLKNICTVAAATLALAATLGASAPKRATGSKPEITVSGTVADASSGDALAGASVVRTGISHGVITDAAGHYSIKAAVGDKLSFSLLGYESLTVEVAGPTLDVKLNPDKTALEDVVVVGYGAAKRSVATGSVSTVSEPAFESSSHATYGIEEDYSFDDFSEDAEVSVPAVAEEEYAEWGERKDSRRHGHIAGQRYSSAGVITAGEWNDLDNWDFWRTQLQREEYRHMPAYWGFEGIDRKPKSHAARPRNANGEWYGNGAPRWKRTVEVAFMVDATGSMSDELEFLKRELVDVVERVEGTNPGAEVLTGSVFYRDEGDDYVTRLSPLTREVARTAGFIERQWASGGGDYPEAVHTALERSVGELQWSDGAHAKILFVLLDAPPHHRPGVVKSIRASVARAAAKGIRIVPIVASGIDKETEFLMRFMAIETDGTYVFITDHSGVGNTHLKPTVGRYRVELLNDLIVRLVSEYAA